MRFAPSPTGYVHLGSARTALFNLLFARASGGSFVLRLEDTDVGRNRPEYEEGLYEGLRWLGLDWDEGPDVGGPLGPYRQSERLDVYREHAARLLAAGAAYRCYCTPEEIEAERQAARAEGRAYRYSRRCLNEPPAGRTSFAVRFRVPEGGTSFSDLVRGELDFDNSVLGDPVIVRSNGWPTYNFANPIDDALMEISHVFRGEEHVPNTPYQVMFAAALGLPAPVAFAHFPVIVGKDGKKLSKRLHPETRLGLYRERGYLPEALLNYLALLGWNPGTEQEIFSFDELVGAFDIRRPEVVRAAAPALKERLTTLGQARDLLSYLWQEPPAPQLKDGQREMLQAALERLESTEWTVPAIEAALEGVREARGWSRGRFFTPIRESVAGRVAPPLFDTLALLPKPVALDRMRRVLA